MIFISASYVLAYSFHISGSACVEPFSVGMSLSILGFPNEQLATHPMTANDDNQPYCPDPEQKNELITVPEIVISNMSSSNHNCITELDPGTNLFK